MKKIWNQTGRSMVEILGVLAIMGVLSVLGVYSYRYAMLRLKANEVIDFVSMFYTRALASDAGECVELTTNDDIGMPTSDLLDGLSITLTSCPHEGCGGHIKLEGESLETEEGKKICSQLVKAFGNEPTPGSPLIVDCAGLGYDSNCPAGRATGSDSDECTACQDGYLYLSYDSEHPCQEVPEDFGCTSNDDCEEGKYCSITGLGLVGTDCPPTQGSCQPIGTSTSANNIAGLNNVIKSNTSMTWWSAENWCKAQRRRLVTIEDINCYNYKNPTQKITEGPNAWSYCCKEGQSCVMWRDYWNGRDIKSEHEDLVMSQYSATIVALRQAFGDNEFYLWTASDYASDNSCLAFLVNLRTSAVDGDRRSVGYCYALCK